MSELIRILGTWESLLWIAVLELITLPIVVWAAMAIINGYFSKKREYESLKYKAISDVFNSVIKSNAEKQKEAVEWLNQLKDMTNSNKNKEI